MFNAIMCFNETFILTYIYIFEFLVRRTTRVSYITQDWTKWIISYYNEDRIIRE